MSIQARLIAAGVAAAISSSTLAQCVWTKVGNPGGTDIRALTSWDPDGAGPAPALLVAAGTGFAVSTWDGATWQQLGSPITFGTALTVYQGSLIAASAVTEDSVLRWDGSDWIPMGPTFTHAVAAFGVDPDGNLVASTYGNGPASRWNGTSWVPLGVSSSQYGMSVRSFAGDLIVGGTFSNFNGPAMDVGRWTGSAWEPLGTNQPPLAGPSFAALFAHHGYLYFCGANTGGVWHMRGGTWELEGATDGAAVVLNEFNDELIAAGGFTTIGGVPANGIASYNGTTWSPLGLGITLGGAITSTIHNGDLYIAGTLTRVGGLPGFGHIARWTCPACYANCDTSSAAPVLTANDFQCFLNKYAANDPFANCDGSTATPVLTANDFQCFLNKFAAGCN